MRANKSRRWARGKLVHYPALQSTGPGFYRSNLSGDYLTQVYSYPLRLTMIVGLTLGLWVFIGLSAALII
jgi:hypothetical protein